MNIKSIVKWILFIAIIGIVYPACYSICATTFHNVKIFFHAQADYDRLRKTFPIFDSALEAKEVIPSDAAINFSPSKWNLYRVAARYSLYPYEAAENWDYFVDFTKNATADPKWRSLELSTGVPVFAKSGHEFQPARPFLRPYPIAKNFFIFLLLAVYQCWLGRSMLKLFRFFESGNSGWVWGTSYLLGYLVLTLLLWILLMPGVKMTMGFVTVSGVALGVFLHFMAARSSAPGLAHSVFNQDSKNFLTKIIQIFSCVIIAAIFCSCVFNVVSDWDAMSNWIMKAKVIYNHKRLDFAYTHHNYYPILWPLNIALQFTLANGIYDEMAQWTSGLFFLLILIQLKQGLSWLGASVKSQWLAIFFYLILSQYLIDLTTSNAENIFIAFLILLIVLLIKWMDDPQNAYWRGGIALTAAGLVLIKLEGTATVMLIILSLLSLNRKFLSKKDLYLCTVGLAGTLVLGVLWAFWIKQNGYLNGIIHMQENLSWTKFCKILKFDFSVFLRSPVLIILLSPVLYFILYPNQRSFSLVELFLLRVSILLIVFSAFAYLGLSSEQIEGAFHDAFPRLLMHAIPPLALLWAKRANDRIPES